MTDGASTGEDPELIVRRIMNMSVPDGNVLIENIFISDEIMQEQITNIKKWEALCQIQRLQMNMVQSCKDFHRLSLKAIVR